MGRGGGEHNEKEGWDEGIDRWGGKVREGGRGGGREGKCGGKEREYIEKKERTRLYVGL